MTTLEGNKLIAEFMGFGHEIDKQSWEVENFTEYYTDRSQYHSSWDWLIPVVEKIDNLPEIDFVKMTGCQIVSKIERVWQAVVDFLTWYNQQGTKINR